MKCLLIHNAYGRFSGEEAVVEGLCRLLAARGQEVVRYTRSSEEIAEMRLGKVRAMASGVHSRSSCKAVRAMLREHGPDVVNVHNVFPLISPSVLKVCREEGVPVVMTVHNYRLVCPNGLFLSRGEVCERCSGGGASGGAWCGTVSIVE